MVGGGWFETNDIRGAVAVGGRATVWDGEVAGREGALRVVGNNPVLVLSDSQAGIMVGWSSGKGRIAQPRELREVVYLISKCEIEYGVGAVSLAWVKAHMGIPGNDRVGIEVNAAVEARGRMAFMERGIRALVKKGRRKEKVVKGFGMGRVV